MPIRIYDLARKLGLESKQVLAKAKELGITTAKVPSSLVDRVAAEHLETQLRSVVGKGSQRGLRSVALGNFKAFAETQNFPIRPLTLIFGANSSGKSSFIHGLLLAHHGLETGELDAFKTVLGGDAVDLGGFRQYVHRRNTDAFAEFAADLSVDGLASGLRTMLPASAKVLRLELRWGASALAEDEEGRALPRTTQVRMCDFLLDGMPLLRFFRRMDGHFQIKELGQEVFRPAVAAMIQSGTTAGQTSPDDVTAAGRAFAEFATNLHFDGGGCLPGQLVTESIPAATTEVPLQPVSRGTRAQDLGAAFRLFAPRLVSDMLARLTAAFRGEMRRLAYLGPLRSFPPRHLPFGDIRDTNWEAGGGKAWDILRRDATVRQRVNAWLSDGQRLSTPFEVALRRHVASADLEPLLEEEFEGVQLSPPQADPKDFKFRSYRSRSATIPKDLLDKLKKGEMSKADLDSEMRSREERGELDVTDETEEERFHFDFDPEKAAANALARIHEELETIDDIALMDKRTNTLVTHRDVGIGISQVLPVLVHAYADEGKIVAIEQPEIHLHPALQAELGDVFIESALGERKNTFLLETHSEHLILRILRRVRETTEKKLPQGATPVRPEDVSVLFVEPTAKGSVVKHMTVTPDGDFAEAWPGGFFAERLADLP